MNSDIVSKSILNELEDVVYISYPNTYELYYMNASLCANLGNLSEEQWSLQKCYKVLQGLDAPCPFCTNHLLCEDRFYNWEHYNKSLDSYYDIQDKLVSFEGIQVRLEIAKNINKRKKLEQDLTQKLEEQQLLNSCISLLHTSDPHDVSINKLLGLVAQYHGADRGYIFILENNGLTLRNSHEWCAEGVSPEIESLQAVDYNYVASWFELYEKVGEFFIDSVHDELDVTSAAYQILLNQGISSLVTAPLYNTDGSFMGFMGVDNPTLHMKETSIIRAVSSFVADFMDKSRKMNQLYHISYFDSLTGMRNRHSYSTLIAQLQNAPPHTLGVVYIDINGLKAMNDIYGHNIGDEYILDLSNFLKSLYNDCSFRIGGDEFVMLCPEKEEEYYNDRLQQLQDHISQGEFPRAAIGYCWREGNCNVIEQIEIADHMMYRIKQEQYEKYSNRNPLFRRKHLYEANHHNPVKN